MRRKRAKGGFAFRLSREKIEQSWDAPAYDKLKWLQDARDFTYMALSKEKLALWQKFRRGEV